MAAKQLGRAGAEVRQADSAAAAMQVLGEWVPDVLLSDIAMPGEDGYALLRRLRTSSQPAMRNLPAIALTAFARSEDQERALAAGFQKHLPKPFDPAALYAAVGWLAAGHNTDSVKE